MTAPALQFEQHGYDDLRSLMTLMTGDEKHSSSATSTLDVLWTLYDSVLRYRPDEPDWPARDRFFLSKGHGPMAYYAVLAAKGFFPSDLVEDFGSFDSILGYHPDGKLIPGVEISSGSLGHGLPMALGAAAGLGMTGNLGSRVFVLIGDAELDEGSNHEAIAVAPALRLANLTAIVIDNQSATHGWPGGIAGRFEVAGWSATVVDGRDHDQIERALSRPRSDVPHVVVAEVESK